LLFACLGECYPDIPNMFKVRKFSGSLRDEGTYPPLALALRPSAWMLDVFGHEVIHVIADAVAKGVTDFPHTVKSGDQAIAAARG